MTIFWRKTVVSAENLHICETGQDMTKVAVDH